MLPFPFRVSLLLAFGLSSLVRGQPLDWRQVEPDLQLPEVVGGKPQPGKRVRLFHDEHQGHALHHTLYLPTDWKPGGSWPVIVEYAGNRHRFGDGSVESCKLGYGISGGKRAIWLCLPFVDPGKKANAPQWWGDVDATVAYCKKTVKQVCEDYRGDPSKVFLAGFSRGSIACNLIGLHDDEIASLWCGFICHSHYDGSAAWPGSTPQTAAERLKRLKGRPQFISHEASVDPIRGYLNQALPDGNFTFLALPFEDHTDQWVLRDLAPRRTLREWFKGVCETP